MTRAEYMEELISNINFIAGDQNMIYPEESIKLIKNFENSLKMQLGNLQELLQTLLNCKSNEEMMEIYDRLNYQFDELINDRVDFLLEEEGHNDEEN